jgi:hypothetical protein
MDTTRLSILMLSMQHLNRNSVGAGTHEHEADSEQNKIELR